MLEPTVDDLVVLARLVYGPGGYDVAVCAEQAVLYRDGEAVYEATSLTAGESHPSALWRALRRRAGR